LDELRERKRERTALLLSGDSNTESVDGPAAALAEKQ
jgi:hypothetical protein